MTKAKYQQIEEILRRQITNGHYQEGDLIPKEFDLAEKYQISRPTIRHAVQDLVNQGYLERRKHVLNRRRSDKSLHMYCKATIAKCHKRG